MMLLSEADYCISKIKMQVSGIEQAQAIHRQLFNNKTFKSSGANVVMDQIAHSGTSTNNHKTNQSSNPHMISDAKINHNSPNIADMMRQGGLEQIIE
jgi:hypothetical protein